MEWCALSPSAHGNAGAANTDELTKLQTTWFFVGSWLASGVWEMRSMQSLRNEIVAKPHRFFLLSWMALRFGAIVYSLVIDLQMHFHGPDKTMSWCSDTFPFTRNSQFWYECVARNVISWWEIVAGSWIVHRIVKSTGLGMSCGAQVHEWIDRYLSSILHADASNDNHSRSQAHTPRV